MAKTIKTRIKQKHDIEYNWNLATNFIPESGEIILYDPDVDVADASKRGTRSVAQMKIGNGKDIPKDLPFSTLPVEWDPIYDTPIVKSKNIAIDTNGGDNETNILLDAHNSLGESKIDVHTSGGASHSINITTEDTHNDKHGKMFINTGSGIKLEHYDSEIADGTWSDLALAPNEASLSASNGYGYAGIAENVSSGGGSSVEIRADEATCGQAHYGEAVIGTSKTRLTHNTTDNLKSELILSGGNADINAPSGNITLTAPSIKIDGALDATFDATKISGTIPQANLPSYVDDVLEYSNLNAFPTTGEAGKIYIALDTNKTYRWSGTIYAPIGADLALGETSSTAFRGDQGKVAYNHATAKGNAYNTGFYKVGTNAEGHVTSATAVSASDITGLIGQPDWDQADSTAANYIKNKISFTKGKSNYSIQQEGNTAIGVGTVSMGADSVAGSKCYYIGSVDTANKQIYLSTTQIDLANSGSNVSYEISRVSVRTCYEEDTTFVYEGKFVSNGTTFSKITVSYKPYEYYPIVEFDDTNVIQMGDIYTEYQTITFKPDEVSDEFLAFVGEYGTLIEAVEASTSTERTIPSVPELVRNAVVGKYIFIRNARHYEFLAKVVSLTEDGILTYDGTLGFDTFVCLEENGIPKPDEWTLRIPEVSDFGEVILAKNEGRDSAATNGASCHAAGIDSFSINMNNTSGGHYSFTSGRDNMTGYGAFSTGRNNKSMCLYSFTNGIGNIAGYNPDHTADEVLANLTTDYLYYAYNHAEGQNTRAVRRAAHSQGIGSIASGLGSFAGGSGCEASGDYSTALGTSAKAKGTNAAVFGNGCEAEGFNALVAGLSNKVYGHHAFAVGRENTIASGANYAAIFGYGNNVTGEAASAFGQGNTSSAKNTFVACSGNKVSGANSTAFGINNTITSVNSFAAGNKNTINAKDSFVIGQGNKILAATSNGKTYGTCFVAGTGNTADGGYNTTLGGTCENYGLYSITNGLKCKEYANHAIVTGRQSIINSDAHYSFSTGYANTSDHQSTIVGGRGLATGRNNQAIFGEFNEVNGDALLVVGNGDCTIASDGTVSGTRSNAMIVKKNGDIVASGNIILGNTTLTEAKLKDIVSGNMGSGLPEVPDETKEYIAKYVPGIGWTAVELTEYNGGVV